MDYNQLSTEQVNPDTENIDMCSSFEIVRLINSEDKKVAAAVEKELPRIAEAVDLIVDRFRRGGRLIYIGAGTSGRLGVLDASECPPTFGTDPSMVMGIIAGGDAALRSAVEKIEDCDGIGRRDMQSHHVGRLDAVVGITASGNARYVCGALQEARRRGAATIAVCNTRPAALSAYADVSVIPIVGPEVIMGSTRMKAGTAQKMVLNMLTTASMIQLGKTYRNLMVDLVPSNQKLLDRSIRIVMAAAAVSRERAEQSLRLTGGDTKAAIVMLETGCSPSEASHALKRTGGVTRKAILSLQRE
jgi:N-acetylmuramic acid 6-phosphate etherase